MSDRYRLSVAVARWFGAGRGGRPDDGLRCEGGLRIEGRPREVLSGDTLSEVYGQALRVVDHPFLDCPLVLVAG
jgi:hypothetical protein